MSPGEVVKRFDEFRRFAAAQGEEDACCGPELPYDYDYEEPPWDEDPPDRPGEGPEYELQAWPLFDVDALFVRVVVRSEGNIVWDDVIRDEELEILEVVRQISAAFPLDQADVRADLAGRITELRSQWFRGREAPREGGAGGLFAQAISSAEFAEANYARSWLIKPLLVAGEPVVVGGPKKALKTSLAVDLVISLGSGTPFLGHFPSPAPVRCLIFSGESGEATLQETAKRVCAARGIHLKDCDIIWNFRLPRLTSPEDLAELEEYVAANGVKVVIIDPLYLCLLQSGLDVSAANLFQVGPLLQAVSRACTRAGATPILLHHARKQSNMVRTAGHEPLDLDDLAYSGIAEFARQWFLVNRRELYADGTGSHRVWLRVGGSSGQGGLWGLDVEEGQLADDFSGRRWHVVVHGRQALSQQAQARKEQEHQVKADQKKKDARRAVVGHLRHHPEGDTTSGIIDATGKPKTLVREVLSDLLRDGSVTRGQVEKASGKGQRGYDGWIPAARLSIGTDPSEVPTLSPGA
jgi:hypothetical protein